MDKTQRGKVLSTGIQEKLELLSIYISKVLNELREKNHIPGVQKHLRDIAGPVPDHCNKVNIEIK